MEERIQNDFTYHAPTDQEGRQLMQDIRSASKVYATTLNRLCPDGREKSSALTKVEEAMFHALAGVSRNGFKANAL